MTEIVLVFVILTIVNIVSFVLALHYTNQGISEVHGRIDETNEAVSETISVVNTNADLQKVNSQFTQENNVDIALLKRIVEVQSRAMNVTLPKREWDALLESIKETNERKIEA